MDQKRPNIWTSFKLFNGKSSVLRVAGYWCIDKWIKINSMCHIWMAINFQFWKLLALMPDAWCAIILLSSMVIGFQFNVYLNSCSFGSSPLFWMVDLKPIQFSLIQLKGHILFINDGVTRFNLVSSKGVPNGIIEWVDSYYGNFVNCFFINVWTMKKEERKNNSKEKSWHD